MSRQDAVEVLAIVAATWSGSAAAKSPEIAVAVWADALEHLPRDVVDRALKVAIRREEFAPSPATIMRLAREITDVGPVNRGGALPGQITPPLTAGLAGADDNGDES